MKQASFLTFALAPWFAVQAITVYVAPTGNDAAPGTEDRPFATLVRARDAVRELKAKGPSPQDGIVVDVRGGVYVFAQPLELSEADSGKASAPIVYRAHTGEDVRLLGGRIVAGWSPVTNSAVLARLDASARTNVWQADLRAMGITDFGRMESDASWTASRPGLQFFFDDKPMTLARWPNDGAVEIGELKVRDGHAIQGIKGSMSGIFSYADDRPKRWTGEKDVMLHGYWFHDWADQRYRVASIDTEQRTITLPEKPRHAFGFRKGQRYYAYNLLCELDRPCEWYLDRENGILYFWPPAASPTNGYAMVSVLPHVIEMKKTSFVTLRGFILEGSRDDAVSISGGNDDQILGCVIRNVGGSAVNASGLRHRVVGCDIYQTAQGGISLSGGDRRTLTPGGLEAVNNHIHHYALWKPVYRSAIHLDGVGNRAANNLIHDAPHMAIGFSGNDHVIEYNEIYHVVTQSNDAGVMYSGYNWSMRGNVIRYNYLHEIQGYQDKGCCGVYLDDQFSSALVFGNLFVRVRNAVVIGGGHDTTVENNVFVNCKAALYVDARGLDGWQSDGTNRLIRSVTEMPYATEPWRSRYPTLAGILDDPDRTAPKGNVIVRNIQWGGKWDSITKNAYPYLVFKYNLLDLDPKFEDEKAGNFRLKADSPAFKIGFQPIPLEKIGLYKDDIRTSLPPTE